MSRDDIGRSIEALRRSQAVLERQFKEQTAELTKANKALQEEIAARSRAQDELRVLLTITRAVTEAKDFGSGLAVTIRNVCEFTDWEYGEAWAPNEQGTELVLVSSWHRPNLDPEKFGSLGKGFSFPPNVGLPGRVWATQRSEWIPDVSIQPGSVRCPMLAQAGVKAAFGVPITAGEEVVAVLVFCMLQSREADRHQIEVVSAVAAQLGSIVHHKQTEDVLHRNEALLCAIMDNSTRVIYVKDPHGRYIAVNREYESRHHVTRDQVRGKTDYDLFPKEKADAFRANDLKVIEAKLPMEFEEVAPHDDGLHTFISNKFPMFDSSGGLYAVCGISTDITGQKRHERTLLQAREELEIRVREQTAELAKANEALKAEIVHRKQTEETLRRTEAELRQVVESVSDYIWSAEVDREGRFIYRYYSPVVERITGYPPQFYMHRPERWLSTIYPEDRPRLEKAFARITTGQSDREEEEYRIILPDGTIRWVRDSANSRKLEDGTIRLDGVVSDITERKRIEGELAARHRELLILHRISEITLSAHSLETAFQEIVEEISAATAFPAVAIELYDEARQKMVFKGIKGIPLTPGKRTLEVPVVETLSGIVARSGQPMVETNAWERPEYAHRVLRELSCRTFVCVPMKDSKRVVGVLSLASPEVTRVDNDFLQMATELANHVASLIERKRAEAWLRSLIEATQDAVVSIDGQGRIVLFNPSAERMFGYAQAEIQGRKVNLLMAEPYASEHDGYVHRYEETGEARAIGRIRTVTAKRKSGELFPIELSVAEIASDEGIHYAAFLRDITDKVRLQNQVVEGERLAAIGTTAAKLAHELTNPLNGMYLTVQLLEQQLAKQASPPDTQLAPKAKRIKDEISRLNQLLQQFRALSRREKFDFRPTTLAALAVEALEIEEAHYARLGIQVEYSFPPDLPTITVDIDKMKQAILNLCKNAAEAMPGGGRISLRGSATDSAVMLEVSDTGAGVPPDIDIFEPFVTTKHRGTGLGLVIVRQIVAAHDGTLTYRSDAGKGTTFIITLPRK